MASADVKTQDVSSSTPTLGGTLQRAIQMSSFGGPTGFLDTFKLVTDKPKPRAGPGEVVVRMRMRPLNPADVFSLMGIYPGFQPSKFPATPGLEGMGHVDSLGLGVSSFEVGQRVVPLLGANVATGGEGSWQEYVCVSEEALVPVPDGVTDEAAAQLLVNPATAIGMIKDMAAPPGAYLIQSAAGSALGRMIIALAPREGVKTINVVRRAAQVEELKALGADEVICSTEEDVVQRVKDITGGQMAYGGFDCVAGSSTGTLASAVREGGTVFLLGGAGGTEVSVGIGDLIFRDVTIKGWWLTRYLGAKPPQDRKALLVEIMGWIEAGVITPTGGEKMDLADLRAALVKQQEVARAGKILLTG